MQIQNYEEALKSFEEAHTFQKIIYNEFDL